MGCKDVETVEESGVLLQDSLFASFLRRSAADVQVQVHPKKASGGADRRQASDAVLAKITTGSRHT